MRTDKPTVYYTDLMTNLVGIEENELLEILESKKICDKQTAYYITKVISSNSEIEDYFERVS
jgi:ferritin-like protein